MMQRGRVISSILTMVMLFGCAAVSFAQSKQPQSAAAMNANAPAPLHDLSGIWNAHDPASIRRFIGDRWTAEEPALTPWGEAKFKEAKSSNGGAYTLDKTNDPVIKECLPPGVPRIYMQPFPMQIANIPKMTLLLYEYDHTVRRVYTDGRPHPKDVNPTYMGDSIGKWDGDTFVVDTVGFNDKTWLDRIGHPHSDELHVIERFRRTDANDLEINITMEDPKALEKPWVQTIYYQLKPDWNIEEQVCTDNFSFLNFEK